MSSPSTKSSDHHIKSGETLADIARQQGITPGRSALGEPEDSRPQPIRKDKVETAKRTFPELSDVEHLQAAVSR